MAEEAGLVDLYLTFFFWASSMHHGDVVGLALQIDKSVLGVDVAPSERWIDTALVIGHGSLIRTLNYYNEVAQMGMDQEIQQAVDDFKAAWGKLRA